MAKEFKTIDELVTLLESRGVETDPDTAGILRRESYYAVVNGYKEPFLDREAMQASPSDVFRPGTTFKQLYDLYLFDRELRATVLPFLMEAESYLKNAVVYAFCERNRDVDAYLDRSAYASSSEMLFPRGFRGDRRKERDRRLADLMARLNGKLAITGGTRPFVRHYLETYGSVPLWVLQNDMTFGNIQHFYQLQKRGVQNAACRIVEEQGGRRLKARELLDVISVLVGFRNICAHGDRMYCAEVKGRRADTMFDGLALVLSTERRASLESALNAVTLSFVGRVDPKALNVMYTDPGRIPQEYRQPLRQRP